MVPRLIFIFFLLLPIHSKALEPVTELPFRIHGNYILVQVGVNQSAPLDFIFDISAMETIVTSSVADKLGMVPTGERQILTASEIRTLLEVEDQNLQMGGVNMNGITVLVDDHNLDEFNQGHKINGIIGYPIFSNYVIDIDYDNLVIRLFDPENYVYSGPGKEIEFTLMYNIPKINGQIGINDTTTLYGEFLLDTGSDYALILTTPYLKKNGLLRKLGPHYTIENPRNPRTQYIHSRITGMNMASFFFPNISAVYSVCRSGLMAFKTFDGIIGNDILKRFNVTYDHINSKLYLAPNSLYQHEFRSDCSGLVLRYNGVDGRIWVSQVFEDSAANMADVQVGDTLKAVNFNPVFNLDLVQIRGMLMQPEGKVDLELERKGKIIQRTIDLQPLI